ncbi:MAG: hypothetical protein DMF34_01210 [Verrucomicrobia bacterium]|nr:MAG: hypothetical protein DMF34_01210 [Verrucomicrobiota bacterium]
MQQLNGLRALANNGITSKGLFIVVASQPLYGIGLAKFWKKPGRQIGGDDGPFGKLCDKS